MLLEPIRESRVINRQTKTSEDMVAFTLRQIEDLLREQGCVEDHFENRGVDYQDSDSMLIQFSYLRDSTEKETEEDRLKAEKLDLDREKLAIKNQKAELIRLAKKLNYTLQKNGK